MSSHEFVEVGLELDVNGGAIDVPCPWMRDNRLLLQRFRRRQPRWTPAVRPADATRRLAIAKPARVISVRYVFLMIRSTAALAASGSVCSIFLKPPTSPVSAAKPPSPIGNGP